MSRPLRFAPSFGVSTIGGAMILFLLALLSSGCSTTSPRAAATLEALPIVNAAPCDSLDCATQWERAQVWIARHSRWKIQTASSVLIQTYNPKKNDLTYGFIVTREPEGEGRYRIQFEPQCGNFLGCDPSKNRLTRAFYRYILTGEDVLVGMEKPGSGIK
jgi:hypothetical protein